MVFAIVGRASRVHKKTHDRCQPWVFVEIQLFSTSAYGGVAYDDHQQLDLSDC
jgi:hypothetical protein